MNLRRAIELLRKARLETQDATLSEVYKMLAELVREVELQSLQLELLSARLDTLEEKTENI